MRLFKRADAPPPQLLRLSLLLDDACAARTSPSLPSRRFHNIDELMASATDTAKPRRGFPFPWLSRKHSSAPTKYAVTPSSHHHHRSGDDGLMRSAVSQLSLSGDYWKASSESLHNNNNNNYQPLNNNNNVLDGGGAMFRSVSTSALFDDDPVFVEIDTGEDLLVIDPALEGGSVGGGGAAVPLGTVLEEEDRPDTESLTSSIQHRSDESGYESDGTKTSSTSDEGKDSRLAALFHRLTGGDGRKDDPQPPRKSSSSSTTSYEARSLRLRTPAMLSNFVQRHHAKEPKPTTTEDGGGKAARAPSSSKLGQFKAWTLDRKLLRSRWKKTALPDDKLDVAAAVVPSSRRGSIFQSSLFPDDSSSPLPHHLETKSLPSLSSEAIEDSNCGGLNYQIRLKKAGYKSASSSTNARRRLWLQSQLSTTSSDSEDVLSPPPPPAETKDPPRRLPSQLELHELVSVDLRKDEHGELGIYITGCTDAEKNVLGYIVMDLEKGGPAERSGKLLKGDELLIVNGQQLQGVGLEEARRLLRVPESDMHLLLARELPDDLCFKEDSSRLQTTLPPVPELHESNVQASNVAPRLRHWQSDVSSYSRGENRRSNPDLPPRSGIDNERMGSNGICTLPRRPKSSQLSLHTVVFEKGPGRKSLGFSIVGGKDSPKGELGFYVKTIFANGQAAETGCLKEGDEIYTLNGQPLQGLSHSEAIAAFKKIKQGSVVLHIGRRTNKKSTPLCESNNKLESNNSKSCSTLDNI